MRTGFLKKLLWTLMVCALLFGAQAMAEEGYQDHAKLLRDGYLPAKQPMDRIVLRGETFEEYMLAKVEARETYFSIEAYQLTPEQMRQAFTDLIDVHPELFYVNNTWTYWANSDGYVTEIEISYLYTEAEIAEKMAAFDASVNAIVRYASQADTTLGKVMMVHDYLCVNYEYDNSLTIHSAEEMFRLGTGVCQAYMQCFQAVMNELGIECVPVTSESMNHGWNAVKVNGNWYHLDATWDDPTADMPLRARHQYFLLSDAGMEANGHSNWTAAVTASSTAYDTFFWSGVNTTIPVVGDVMYYVDPETAASSRTVKAWDMSDGSTADVHSYDIATVDGSILYASGYNPIAASDSHLYYMTIDSVYGMELAGGVPVLMHTTSGTDYIWSSWFDGSQLQVYASARPGSGGTIITLDELSVDGAEFTYADNGDGTATITGYNGTEGIVSIPETVNGLTVTGIGSGAFAYCETVTQVHLSAAVNTIASDAFMPYCGIAAFTVDENNAAFTALDGVLYDQSMSTLVCYPARKTDTGYTVADGVKNIGENAFYQNYHLEKVGLPEGVETIGAYAFEDCSELAKVNLPESITFIGENAFAGCGALTATVMQNSYAESWCIDNGVNWVLEGGVSADGLYSYTLRYDGTANITAYYGTADHVDVPSEINGIKVTMLGIGSFSGSSMSSITLPEGIQVIAKETFAYCENLTSIHLPSTVLGVADSAFGPYCGAAEITVAEGNTALCSVDGVLFTADMYVLKRYPSGKTDSSYTVPAGVTEIYDSAFLQNHYLESVVLPDGVEVINSASFDSCSALTWISLPASAEYIADDAFANCGDLTAVVPENSYAHTWCVENGVTVELESESGISGDYSYVTNGDGTVTITGFTGAASYLEVPAELEGMTVTGIASQAFSYCEAVLTIRLPASITEIADGAFMPYCGVWSFEVDEANPNYTAVGDVLFSKDMSTLVCYPSGRTEWEYTVPDGVTAIADFAVYQNSYLGSIVLPDSVAAIGDHAFEYCIFLNSINLPASISEIGEGAFWNCGPVVAKVEDGSYALDWCIQNNVDFEITGLEFRYTDNGDGTCTITGYTGSDTSLKVPASIAGLRVTEIGNGALSWYSFTQVILPDTLQKIGDSAFNGCERLMAIVIPASVMDISVDAFEYSSWDMVIYGTSGSFAETYAAQNGFAFKDVSLLPEGEYISGDYTYTLTGNDAIITAYTGSATELQIPAQLDGHPVVQIAYAVFENSSMTSVTIPDGVTHIEDRAFRNCTELQTVVLPESLLTIGDDAFIGCSRLSGVRFPENITRLGMRCFEDCVALTSVVLPDSLTYLDDDAFEGCAGLTSAKLSPNLTYAGTRAFMNCTSLTEVIMPQGITSIGYSMFMNCTSLAQIAIPDGVVEINAGAFKNCPSLTSVVLPDSVEYLGMYSFLDCTSLTSVVMPESLMEVDYQAFYGCTALDSLFLPDQISYIGNMVFADNTQVSCNAGTLTEETLAAKGYAYTAITRYSYTDNGDGTCTVTGYPGTESSLVIPDSIAGLQVTAIGERAFIFNTTITEVTLPEGLLSIGESAFQSCYNLQSISFPSTLTSIGHSVFQNCTALNSVYVPEGVTSIGNYAFRLCTGLYDFAAPESLTSIGTAAFQGCTSLMLVDLGSVEQIPSYLFDGCTNLRMVSYTNSLDEVTDIGSYAFRNCSALTDARVGSKLATVGDGAFEGCTMLTKLMLPDEVKAVGRGAFDAAMTLQCHPGTTTAATLTAAGYAYETVPLYTYRDEGDGTCTILAYTGVEADVVIPSEIDGLKVRRIGDIEQTNNGVFYMNKSIASVVIPEGVTEIDNWAFGECSNLTSVSLPDGLIRIGAYAFAWCDLESIELPDSVNAIETDAFTGNTRLTAVDLPASLNSLSGRAFSECGLTAVALESANTAFKVENNVLYTIDGIKLVMFPSGVADAFAVPDGVTTIGESAFMLSRLSEVTLPSSVRSIEANAFANMNDLMEIDLNEGLQTIGDYAFSSCSGLTEIRIPSTVISIGDGAFSFTDIASIAIPEGVTALGQGAFQYCYGLTSVALPSTLASIGDYAFMGCNALETLALPDHITSVGLNMIDATTLCVHPGTTTAQTLDAAGYAYETVSEYAYTDNGDGTATITGYTGTANDPVIPDSVDGLTVTRIGMQAFYGSSITSVILPETLTAIDIEAFAYCTALQEITIPAGVTEVTMYMDGQFAGCTALENIYVAEGNTAYVSVDGVLYNKDMSMLVCFPAGRGGSYTVPATVRTISFNAFGTNDKLTALTLQEGVSIVDVGAFRAGAELSSVVFPENSIVIGPSNFTNCPKMVATVHENSSAYNWCLENGYPYRLASSYQYTDNGDGTATITGFSGAANQKMYLPEKLNGLTVAAIAENALSAAPQGAVIWVPDTVASIGASAFPANVVISSSATAYARTWAAENGAAWEHDAHTESVLEAEEPTCTTAGHGEGVWCPDCGKIIVEPAMVPANGHLVIRLKDSTPATREQNGLKASAICETCMEVLSEETTIESSRTLFLPAAIRHVADEAFTGSAAQQITLPEGAVSIGSRAFADCPNLILVVVPDSVQSIVDDAFEGSDQVMLMCSSENSYAAQWAQAHGVEAEILK